MLVFCDFSRLQMNKSILSYSGEPIINLREQNDSFKVAISITPTVSALHTECSDGKQTELNFSFSHFNFSFLCKMHWNALL